MYIVSEFFFFLAISVTLCIHKLKVPASLSFTCNQVRFLLNSTSAEEMASAYRIDWPTFLDAPYLYWSRE